MDMMRISENLVKVSYDEFQKFITTRKLNYLIRKFPNNDGEIKLFYTTDERNMKICIATAVEAENIFQIDKTF
ncbi:hypothetical protein [Eikenella sp. NML070372]|uniref:hypothetical protein n=2 Tax=unclassified Eikenella TaxID=2639367 RepID=UPI000AEDB11D|nr:hypothetical protein [Eikenella sp. NML070372]